jgi:hypothetical protein
MRKYAQVKTVFLENYSAQGPGISQEQYWAWRGKRYGFASVLCCAATATRALRSSSIWMVVVDLQRPPGGQEIVALWCYMCLPAAQPGILALIGGALDLERLCRWQSALFPGGGTSGIRRIATGRVRDHADAMQIVSGPVGRDVVHYEAPPSAQVVAHMDRFLAWFERTRPTGGHRCGHGEWHCTGGAGAPVV